MTDINDIALILNFENNKIVKIPETNERYCRKYEDELVRCLKYFRKNGGKFKNIKIYCLKFKDQHISDDIITKLQLYNANVIEADCNYPTLKTPYMLEVFLGQFFEKPGTIQENVLVKIDIDTVLLREFDDSLFENLDICVKIGQYSKYSSVSNRTTLDAKELPFDNSFIVVDKRLGFFTQYFELCNSEILDNMPEFQSIKSIYGSQYIVEFAIDYMNHHKLFNIQPILNYQIGEAYDDLGVLPDSYLKSVYFIHHHIYNNENDFMKYYAYYLKILKMKNI